MRLLSEIQYKAEESKRQVTTSQQATTFQLPEATQATAGREYILTIPETQTVSIPVVQPTQTATGEPVTVIAKVQQPLRPSSSSSTQPATSYVVVDDQQPGTSRHMSFHPLQMHLHNRRRVSTTLLDYPVSLQVFQVCYSIRSTHHSHFYPLNFKQHHHQCHLPLIKNSHNLPASPTSSQPKSAN